MAKTVSTPFVRILSFDGGLNMRDIGGYATADGRCVRTGLLFRSGHMAKLSEEGAASMAALGISCIVDSGASTSVRRARHPGIPA